MPRFTRSAVLPVLLALVAGCADAGPDALLAPDADLAQKGGASAVTSMGGITVMSQNLYLGANLDLLLTAQTPAEIGEVFQQLTTTTAGDFGRALQIAMEIAANAPHLVGLQEVTRYTFTTSQGTQGLDFLAVLQQYLDYLHYVAQVTPYTYTAIRNDLTHVDFPVSQIFPGAGFPDVTYDDGDAVLVRNDVSLMGAPIEVSYDAFEVFDIGFTTFDNHRGYIAVDAEVNGMQVRFANTHLEVQYFIPTQVAQAEQLIDELDDSPLPVVLVGDFNSAANHDAPEDQKSPSYRMFRQAGFADMWLREPHSVGGVTCCQNATLTNPTSELTQRLDLVLAKWNNAGFGGQSTFDIVGDEQSDRIEVVPGLTLWPSDHAGVVATLWPAPGQRK